MNKTLVGIGMVLLVGVLGWWFSLRAQPLPASGKVHVIASFYPLAEFSRQVGGDMVAVEMLTPPGMEPHDFDPSPQALAKLYQADIFIYNGAGLEPWVSKIKPDLDKNNVRLVEATQELPLVALEDDHDGNEEAHDEGTLDPHVWLSPKLAQKEVEVIAEALSERDPAHREEYQNKSRAFNEKLAKLDQDFQTHLHHCQTRTIITTHTAYRYLARDYNLELIAISGLSPDQEPSPQRLAEVVKLAREHKATHIFFESLVDPKLADTIAQEVGAQTLVLHPIEGVTDQHAAEGVNYVSLQYENLTNLHKALGCTEVSLSP